MKDDTGTILDVGWFSFGFAKWEGKPKLDFIRFEYEFDVYYVLHVGRLWVQVIR